MVAPAPALWPSGPELALSVLLASGGACQYTGSSAMLWNGFRLGAGIGLSVWFGAMPAFAQASWEEAAPEPPSAEPAPAGTPPDGPQPEPVPAPAYPDQAAPPAQPPAGPPPAAYPPPAYPQPYPRIYVAQPPPPPPIQRGRHLHDGFYLRMSLGAGALTSEIEFENSPVDGSTLRGGGGAFDLLIGGTPTPGLAIGGGLLINGASNADIETEGQSSDTDLDLGFGLIGVFVDGFPNPRGGFHVGGLLGGAVFSLTSDEDDDDPLHESSGWGGAVWLGYGGFVSSDWSLGAKLRFAGGVTRSEQESDGFEDRVRTQSVTLLFSALYH